MGKKILLADGSVAIRRVVQLTFSELDHEVDAVGDFGHTSENARVFAEGQLLGVIEHASADCQTTSGTFTLYAGDLAGLAADGLIEIAVENSYHVFPYCPINRHTVRLKYELPLQIFDFGQIFLGTTGHTPLVIANSGSVKISTPSGVR